MCPATTDLVTGSRSGRAVSQARPPTRTTGEPGKTTASSSLFPPTPLMASTLCARSTLVSTKAKSARLSSTWSAPSCASQAAGAARRDHWSRSPVCTRRRRSTSTCGARRCPAPTRCPDRPCGRAEAPVVRLVATLPRPRLRSHQPPLRLRRSRHTLPRLHLLQPTLPRLSTPPRLHLLQHTLLRHGTLRSGALRLPRHCLRSPMHQLRQPDAPPKYFGDAVGGVSTCMGRVRLKISFECLSGGLNLCSIFRSVSGMLRILLVARQNCQR